MHATISRSREPAVSLWTMPGPVWVRCPRCTAAVPIIAPPLGLGRRAPARLACHRCGLVLGDAGRVMAARAPVARIDRWRPRCDRCGRAVLAGKIRPPARHRGALTVGWRCPGCGHDSLFPAAPAPAPVAQGVDPWFGLPLVLRIPIGRHLLWAWNAHHLMLLDGWLGAGLRERARHPSRWSMASRLPGWMQTAAMRPRVTKAIAALRTLTLAEGVA